MQLETLKRSLIHRLTDQTMTCKVYLTYNMAKLQLYVLNLMADLYNVDWYWIQMEAIVAL
jgi:hypothetical protein